MAQQHEFDRQSAGYSAGEVSDSTQLFPFERNPADLATPESLVNKYTRLKELSLAGLAILESDPGLQEYITNNPELGTDFWSIVMDMDPELQLQALRLGHREHMQKRAVSDREADDRRILDAADSAAKTAWSAIKGIEQAEATLRVKEETAQVYADNPGLEDWAQTPEGLQLIYGALIDGPPDVYKYKGALMAAAQIEEFIKFRATWTPNVIVPVQEVFAPPEEPHTEAHEIEPTPAAEIEPEHIVVPEPITEEQIFALKFTVATLAQRTWQEYISQVGNKGVSLTHGRLLDELHKNPEYSRLVQDQRFTHVLKELFKKSQRGQIMGTLQIGRSKYERIAMQEPIVELYLKSVGLNFESVGLGEKQ